MNLMRPKGAHWHEGDMPPEVEELVNSLGMAANGHPTTTVQSAASAILIDCIALEHMQDPIGEVGLILDDWCEAFRKGVMRGIERRRRDAGLPPPVTD